MVYMSPKMPTLVLMRSELESDSTVSAWLGTRFVQVYIDFRVTEGATSTITRNYPGVGEPNGLPINHFHGAQRLGLELHRSLLKARAGESVGPWPLVGRPWFWVVGCLWEIRNRGFDSG